MTKWTSKVSSLGRLCACVFSPCPHSIPHSIPHCSHIIIIFCLIHCQKSVVSICLHIYSLTQCLGQFLQIAVLTHWCLILCICASYAVAKKKKKKDRFLRQWHKHMQPLRGKGRSCKLCFAGETHLSLAAWTAWQSKARPHPESHPTCVKPLLSLELGHWCTQDLCFPACPYSIPYCSLLYCV